MNELLKMEIKETVLAIIKMQLNDTDNFYDNGIDSFSLVEIINSLEEFSKKHKLTVNMDALITEEELTLQTIFNHID